MLNGTSSMNRSCDCPVRFILSLELTRGTFANTLCVLAIISNLFTILVFRRIQKRCSTDNLLLAITVVDLMLPILFLVRHVYIIFGNDWSYRLYLFYLWLVFYNTSILLTVVLAARRFVAIEYPHTYHSLRKRSRFTGCLTLAIFLFCALLFLPLCWYEVAVQNSYCNYDPKRDMLHSVIILDMVYKPRNNFRSFYYWIYVYVIYWLYISFFQILCPLILAGLSFKFGASLKKNLSAPRLILIKNKTKMILLVSLIVAGRDLPVGLLAVSRFLIKVHTGCLTTLRLASKELTVLMSALNFFVLYRTNEKFKKAVPWPASLSRGAVSLGLSNDDNRTVPTPPTSFALVDLNK